MMRHSLIGVGPANLVTLARAVLVVLAASSMVALPTPSLAWTLVGITLLVVVLDSVDGWIARRTGSASAFGARFDMETDACFMLVLSVLVWQHGKAGMWVLALGAMRYVFVAARWVWPWLARPLRSTVRGKTAAIASLVTLGAALAPVVPARVSTMACALALALLTYSFAVDVRYLYRTRHA
jgi:phosphatidylglycerophosphate synthase